MNTKNPTSNPGTTPPDTDFTTDFTGSDPNISWPTKLNVSGLYSGQGTMGVTGVSTPGANLAIEREEVKLDVDGPHPQMTASGVIRCGVASRVHWIARLNPSGMNHYTGTIWHKAGNINHLPWRQIAITVNRTWYDEQRRISVVFTAPGVPSRTRVYSLTSRSFSKINMIIDTVEGSTSQTEFFTASHPNRPESLPRETVTVEKILNRTGLKVETTGTDVVLEGSDGTSWSTAEVVDAMRVWSTNQQTDGSRMLWLLNLTHHIEGTDISSIVMDNLNVSGTSVGSGVAVFTDSFLSQVPGNDPVPNAWIDRMRLWGTMHGIGHTLGIGHSWQKRGMLDTPIGGIPLNDEPESRSFMNCPDRVTGGSTAFFSDFQFRFSDTELLMLRHGTGLLSNQRRRTTAGTNIRGTTTNTLGWFDEHGFMGMDEHVTGNMVLNLRVNRGKPTFEFMEPVTIEMKITNTGYTPTVIDSNILDNQGAMTLIVHREGIGSRQLRPQVQIMRRNSKRVLQPGESIYSNILVSVGRDGWLIDEPGNYTIQVALHVDSGDIISNPMMIRVEPARSYEDELIAQDYFTWEMASLMEVGGSHVINETFDVLREITVRCKNRRVALHAHRLLGLNTLCNHKLLVADNTISLGTTAVTSGARFTVVKRDTELSRAELLSAVNNRGDQAVDTFGNIGYVTLVNKLGDLMITEGDKTEAIKLQNSLLKVMTKRGVVPVVLEHIRDTINRYGVSGKQKAKKATN